MKTAHSTGIIFSIAACCLGFAQSKIQADQGESGTNQIVPIPGPQAYSEPHPVDAIVTDSQGNMKEQTYTYYPNYYPQDADHPDPNVVIINNTQQITSDDNQSANPSLFFPGFAMGFLFAGGYWGNYNGMCWNGNRYVQVNNYNNWRRNWNNHWNHDWNHRWNDHWNQHHNDPNWRYRNNKNWDDFSGKKWQNAKQDRPDGERSQNRDNSRLQRNQDRGGQRDGGRGGREMRGGGDRGGRGGGGRR